MNFKPIFFINGILLLILSAAMLFPVLVDFSHDNPDWRVFAGAQIVTAFFGFSLLFANQQKKFSLTLRETFLLTTISWVMLSLFACLPFYFSSLNLSFAASLFEAVSGLTTTGSTVISGLDHLPQGILLWRSILHWGGGIGVLVIALAVLPLLQISGMQIYKTQSFSEVDKVLPSATQIAFYILVIYCVLTVACTLALHMAGMSMFDALNHAMSTVATGGFSTKDASVGYFNSPGIEVILTVFMLISALPFPLYVKLLRGDKSPLWRDSQVRTFLAFIGICIGLLTIYMVATGQFYFVESFRKSAFMVATLITTTGFVSGDYSHWGHFVVGMAFMMTLVGSCSGSTSGGIKIFRLQILWRTTKQQLQRLMVPHGVFQVHYNGKVVDSGVQMSIASFFFVYIFIWVLFSLVLQMTGLDFATAWSGALTCISNVGPGLGDGIGPDGNFAHLPSISLHILSLAMVMGRLEFFTVLVLLIPRFWRA